MFMGEYSHNIDAKGRLIIPSKFRDELGEQIVITRGLDGCLYIYTSEQWETIYQDLLRLPTTNKDARMYVRMMTSKATLCELDAQGRILIPSTLISIAKIEKECRIVGVASHVEVWAKEVWEAVDDEANANFEDIAESLTEFLV